MEKSNNPLIFGIVLCFLLNISLLKAQDTIVVQGYLTFAIINASCAFEAEGTIDLTIDEINFPGPYTFFWTSGYGDDFSTEDLYNLYATSYYVTVTGLGGATTIGSINIGQPPSLQLSLDITDETCNSYGSIDLSVSGGSPPYYYLWNNGETSQDIFNLQEDFYSILVTDANSCNAVTSVMLHKDSVGITILVNNLSCFGGNNGEIQLVLNGTTPFSFDWHEGNEWTSIGTTISANQNLSNQTAGTYAVQITDGNGCIKDTIAEITQPSTPIDISFSQTNVTCYQGSNGSIIATVSGGIPSYYFSWSSGETTETISGIYAGLYTLSIIDENGCEHDSSITITQPTSALNITFSQTEVSCYQGSDGSISTIPTGGTTPYSYLWSTGETTETILGKPAGLYAITFTDDNDCSVLNSDSITEPSALNLGLSGNNLDCNNFTTGEINLTVSGGISPYNYLWNNGSTIQNLINISAGFYEVIITDANGCISSDSITISLETSNNFIVNYSICEGDSMFLDGTWQTTSGNYYDSLQTYSGCDSIIETILTVDPLPYDLEIFSSVDSIIDIRDGKIYQTVQIGNQCWMAENLAYLPSVSPPDSGSLTLPHYYVYDYSGTNVPDAKATYNYQTYGVLYNWMAATNGGANSQSVPSGVQGACPSGWHLPSFMEWYNLENYLGGYLVAGGKMKETGTSHWANPNTGATNSSGFSALPGGLRDFALGSFFHVNWDGYWWTSSLSLPDTAQYHAITYIAEYATYSHHNNAMGFSVRCVKTVPSMLLFYQDTICNFDNINIILINPEVGIKYTLFDTVTLDTIGSQYGIYNDTIIWTFQTDSINNYYRIKATDTSSGCWRILDSLIYINKSSEININFGPDTIICDGASLILEANSGYISYLWQDSSTSQTIFADTAGTYWVEVMNINGCTGSDTITINLETNNNIIVYYSICEGDSMFLDGTWQTTSGNYYDSLQTYSGCDSIIETILTVNPLPYDLEIFSSVDSFIDYRDGKIYQTVQIGNQCWMAENLAYLPSVGPPDSGSLTLPHYYVYDYSGTNVPDAKATYNYQTYGVLYNWMAATNGVASSQSVPSGVQGACPSGWHVPNSIEWNILDNYLGGYLIAGGKMKETGTSHWASPNIGATNSSGFTGLPGGLCSFVTDSFMNINWGGIWWTSSLSLPDTAQYHKITYSAIYATFSHYNNAMGLSVRCVKTVPSMLLFYQDTICNFDNINIILINPEVGIKYTLFDTVTLDTIGSQYGIYNDTIIWTFQTDSINNYYRIKATDTSSGCWRILDSLIYINKSSEITINEQIINVSVSGSFDGAIDLSISGGIPPYTIMWSNSETTENIFNLSTGSYYVTITDSNSCSYSNYYEISEIISLPFTCGTSTIIDYDSNLYNTILIGNQCWMKENLKSISNSSGNSITRYCYDNNTSNCDTYGGIYDWNTVMAGDTSSTTNPSGVQGICPTGWHVPNDAEWTNLSDYLINTYVDINSSNVGNKLKSCRQVSSPLGGDCSTSTHPRWDANSTHHGTNDFGFAALPGGYYNSGSFSFQGRNGNWWSSTQYSSTYAWHRGMHESMGELYSNNNIKALGFSVRCIKNASIPTVFSDTITNITQTTATGGGEVTNDGGSTVIVRGVCWNTTGNPSIVDSITSDGSGVGTFVSNLTGLTPNSTYFVRAYAINSVGTAYGNEVQFKTLCDIICGDTISDIDGNLYNIVQIGCQCWMKENLRTEHYSDGTSIPLVTSNTEWGALIDNNTDKAFCYYNNNQSTEYGALYTWAAAMNGANSSTTNPSGVQGVCPSGWHLPSDNEWKELEINLGMNQISVDSSGWRGTNEGGKLKEIGTAHWNNPNIGATNYSGFTALPGGYRVYSDGSFLEIGNYGHWWSATDINIIASWFRRLYSSSAQIGRHIDNYKSNGFSVRCVMNTDTLQASIPSVITDTITNISLTSATGVGEVTSNGGAEIIVRGLCWNTTGNPSIANSFTTESSGIGIFISNLTGLTPNSIYYVRAYATNSVGTAYGDEVQFTTIDTSEFNCGSQIYDYDSNQYNTVLIGNQCWMKENLRTEHYADGTAIQIVTSNNTWANLGDNNTDKAFCYYNNNLNSEYGALYTWAAAMNGANSTNSSPSYVQGICPSGWHVPSDNEWKELEIYMGMNQISVDSSGWRGTNEGGKLKENGITHWISPNTGATNESGFTALPGGYRHEMDGSFHNTGIDGFWWSSTENNNGSAWFRYLYYINSASNRSAYSKSSGYSVRCIKDTSNLTALSINYLKIDVSCYGYLDGTIDLSILGGMTPYTYVWSNGATIEDISGLIAGTYFVTIIDVTNDSIMEAFSITEPPPISLSFITTDVSCYGSNDGMAIVVPTGGSNFYVEEYWANIVFGDTISNLSAGWYFVSVTDSSGCTGMDSIEIIEPSEIDITGFITDASNAGTTDGSIYITVSGGISPYLYSWDNGETLDSIDGLSTGIYRLSVTDDNGCIAIDSFEVGIVLPPWPYTITAINHIILIQETIPITINGIQIDSNDYIGVFYDSLGTLVCAGYQIWESTSTTIAAWGEEFGNDGFVVGEEFKWKIWDNSENIEYIAFATYMGVSPPMQITHLEYFAENGQSGLSSLTTSEYQAISLRLNWSYFSTYIISFEVLMDSIFVDIVSNVDIAKDDLGHIYWPIYGINTIGDITICEAYQIKMNNADTLMIEGLSVLPENTNCSIDSGWSYIPYLRKTSASIIDMLSTIVSDIVMVKNYLGDVYWPLYNINMIGNMDPGEGYQIKMNNSATLSYPANTSNFSKSNIQTPQTNHFKGTPNTGSNMTLGIPKTAWENEPPYGSEIGIFSENGKLVGCSVFEEENLAISIWGNDELTVEIDGMIENEMFIAKIWNNGIEEVIEVKNWFEGNEFYKTNKISIVEKLSIVNSQLSTVMLFQNIPNPFKEETSIKYYMPFETEIELSVYNILGEKLKVLESTTKPAGNHTSTFKTKNLPSGTYLYKLEANKEILIKRMCILK
jgi:uncharacterized protein (TIGR02145 family)